jgi:3alpha(or 20beta)-hydroxysteroid dehydrogenase
VSGRLEGKVALVTGAARGIGAAIARRFTAEGAHVLVTDADDEGVRQLAAELGAHARAHDVTDEAAWDQVAAWAVEAHDHIDVLVNNAGVFLAAPLQDTTLEEFRRVQEVNQVGVFLGMRTIAPLMTQRGSGSIINLSSIAGRMGTPYLTAYAASKWAVRGMTKCVAKELAAAGVRVNSLHPGQIDTDMHTRQRERTPELVDKLMAGIPMRRLGDPLEVADAAVFLAADESRYMTGSEVVIDGGVNA